MLPWLAILWACVVWWFNGVFVNMLDLPHAQQTFFRLLVPFIVTGWIILIKRWDQIHRKFTTFEFLTISGANALRMYFLMAGFTLTTVGNAVIAQRANVFIVLILAFLILWEKLTPKKILSVCIGFLWLIFIALEKWISLTNENFLGISGIIFSAIISSYLTIQFKQKIHSLGSTNTIFLQSCIGVILFWTVSVLNYSFPQWEKLFLALFHSFLIGVVGFYLFFWWLRHMEVSKATILTYSEVLSGILFWYIILRQIPSGYTYLWMICIIMSGVILTRKIKRI